MTSSRNPYERLPRSFETQRLEDVLPAAAEVGWINLSDALSILMLMAREGDPRFDRAAARLVGRLLTETPPLTLGELVG